MSNDDGNPDTQHVHNTAAGSDNTGLSVPVTRRSPNARPGNRNALRHGMRGGGLPAGADYIRRLTNQMRSNLEDAVIAAKGEVSIIDAGLIVSAMRWERHALVVQRWLRLGQSELNHDQRLAYSREVARASSERDRCMKALEIDGRERRSIIDALYAPENSDDFSRERNGGGSTSGPTTDADAGDGPSVAQEGGGP